MKKYLFLALFTCGTSVASMGAVRDQPASKSANETAITKRPFTKIKEKIVAFFDFQCINVTYSCGETGVVCGSTGTEIGSTALMFDKIVCGG
jgi:hypothetical protein